ncbi:MAG: class I SAM-dependent methyltransferase [Anaerolineales bacterium]
MTHYDYQLTDQDPDQFLAVLLGEIRAAQVLDVACGPGGFTNALVQGLKEFTHLTAVDVDEEMIARARQNIPDENVDFKLMDAAELQFPAESFDLVGCAFSLHHLPDPERTIAEIRRVLKPGGYALFVEMYRDHLTDTQQTESNLHHWAGRIDTARGISHRQTYLRQEIIEMIAPDEWQSARVADVADMSFDPKGEEITNLILGSIDRVVTRAEGLPDQALFEQQAEELRQRTREIGAHVSTRLMALLQK